MIRLFIFLLLLTIVTPGDSFASLTLTHAGSAAGGGGGGCTTSLNFSQSCNSQYLGVGGLF